MFGINQEMLFCITLALVLLTIVLFVWLFILHGRLAKMRGFQKDFLQSAAGANLEEMLIAHITEVRTNRDEIVKMKEKQDRTAQILRSAVQKVGVVRFNAFEDLGGEQSFAVAMLNAENDGIVLSGIFGRSDMRVYAKPINDNKSSYLLSGEELKAIEKASRKGV